jgi:hypothetical protein
VSSGQSSGEDGGSSSLSVNDSVAPNFDRCLCSSRACLIKAISSFEAVSFVSLLGKQVSEVA